MTPSALEAKILVALASSGPLTAPELGRRCGPPASARDSALARLVAAGVITAGDGGKRLRRFELSSVGRRRLALEAALPDEVILTGEETNALLALVRAESRNGAGASSGAESDGGPTEGELQTMIVTRARALDQAGRGSGMIEIHALRRAFGDTIDRDAFDDALFELARESVIRLGKVTDVAGTSPDEREDAIHHPLRGLLFYLILVQQPGLGP